MKTHLVTHHSTKDRFAANEFEEAFYTAKLHYSLRHLRFTEKISQENIAEALQKSLQVCYLAGINSRQHFKQIYVYDANAGILYIDWLMSKKGFNLMVTQLPSVNENKARWLWQLIDL